MLRRKVDQDGRYLKVQGSDDEVDLGADADDDFLSPGAGAKTPKKNHSNRSFKPASAVLESVRMKYRKFKDSLDDGGFSPEQFDVPEARVPYRSIALAVFLLMAGSAALSLSLLSLSGHISFVPTDGPSALMVLGLLMFVPGFYHVRIAVYAFKQYPGYSFDDIPDFD